MAVKYSSDTGFEDITKKLLQRDSFLVNDTTLASDNPLRFRLSLLGGLEIVMMTTDDRIREKKLHCDINREA